MYKSRYLLILALIVLIILFAFGCRRTGNWLAKEDKPPHSDALVILTGNIPDRVLQAADLWHAAKAGRIIIVEESMGPYKRLEERGVSIISNSEQVVNSLITLGVPPDSIRILPGDARSTLDEAKVISNYLVNSNSVDTILLVSSAPHMRRASLIFRETFRESEIPVYVGCSPSAYSSFNPDRWWRRKEDIQHVLSELAKIVSFRLVEHRKIKS